MVITKENLRKTVLDGILFGHTADSNHINGTDEELMLRFERDACLDRVSTLKAKPADVAVFISESLADNPRLLRRTGWDRIQADIPLPDDGDWFYPLMLDREGNEVFPEEWALRVVFINRDGKLELLNCFPKDKAEI